MVLRKVTTSSKCTYTVELPPTVSQGSAGKKL